MEQFEPKITVRQSFTERAKVELTVGERVILLTEDESYWLGDSLMQVARSIRRQQSLFAKGRATR